MTKEQHQSILNNIIADDDDDEKEAVGFENEAVEDEIEGDPADDNDEPDAGDDDPDPAEPPVATGAVERQPAPREEKLQLGYKADRLGNLIDKEGKVIFPRGKSREVFERVKKAFYLEQNKNKDLIAAFNNLAGTSKELFARYKALKESAPSAHGLTEPEVKEALDLAALMKIDAKAGVKKLLTMLHLNGVDLNDIGVNQPLDAKEVARQVLELQNAKKVDEPSPEDTAKEEAMAFLTRHPQAAQHIGLVAEAKNRYPHMTLDEIWFQIQLHANRQPQQQQQKPNGRVIPRNNRPTGPVDKTRRLSLKAVDPSQSYADIGKQLLHDLKTLEEQ